MRIFNFIHVFKTILAFIHEAIYFIYSLVVSFIEIIYGIVVSIEYTRQITFNADLSQSIPHRYKKYIILFIMSSCMVKLCM